MTLRTFSFLCGAFALVIGVAVLTGWALGVGALKSVLPGYPAAQPVTALAMYLSGGALMLLTFKATHRFWAPASLAAVVAVLSVLTFLAYLGIDTGVDHWLFASRLAEQSAQYRHPGRMAEVTAISFFLVAFAISAKAIRRFERVAAAGATLALLLAAATLLAILYKTAPLYEVAGFAAVSLPTATVLMALSAGALAAEPVVGWPHRLTLDTPGGHAARVLLPWAICMPPLISGAALVVSRAGFYSPDFRLAAVSIVTAATFSAIVMLAAARIDAVHAARERERTARALAEERLQHAQKMAALGQMVSSVAHDINNLLHALGATFSALANPSTDPKRKAYSLETGKQSLARARELMRALLAFARQQPVEKQVFDVVARIRAMEPVLRATIGARLSLALHQPETPVWVEAQPTQFDVALLNLVVNARDASVDGGDKIAIDVETIESRPMREAGSEPLVAIRVRDFGCGIPQEELTRLFEPFYTTKQAGSGTGLGLTQVYAFAQQSGGDLTVESKVGLGSTFTILLPLMERAGAVAAGESRTSSHASSSSDRPPHL